LLEFILQPRSRAFLSLTRMLRNERGTFLRVFGIASWHGSLNNFRRGILILDAWNNRLVSPVVRL